MSNGAMNVCVFCQILEKKIPAEVLFENEHAVAILDINPIHYGHALVIPRCHCKDFLDLPSATYHSVLEAARVVTQALVTQFRLEGYNLFTNNGRIAGQSVFHFHLHITPRYPDDDIRFVLKLKQYGEGELRRTAEQIRNHISTQ